MSKLFISQLRYINMRIFSIVAVFALVLYGGTSAQDINSILAFRTNVSNENVSAVYTMQMPLMDDDVIYSLVFHKDSITATPGNGMPEKKQAISKSPFAAFHPERIAPSLSDKMNDNKYKITQQITDNKIEIVATYCVDSIVGSTAYYQFDKETCRPLSTKIVNNPSSLTEQTITINYIYQK